MTTKQRIIRQAIIEYNKKGVANVTSRDLAKKLGMSHGNLEYHFNSKEAIILSIYKQMRAEISEAYAIGDESEDLMLRFDRLLRSINDFQQKYAFFNLDLFEIARNYKAVDTLLRKTFRLREQQLKKFFDLFVEAGYLKFPDLQSQARLVHLVYVQITFWTYQKEFLPFRNSRNSSESIGLSRFVWDLMLPRMTKTGLKAFNNSLGVAYGLSRGR